MEAINREGANVLNGFSGVIFDMDGVLIDSEPLAIASEQEVYRRHDLVVPDEVQLTFKGLQSREIMRRVLGHCGAEHLDLDELVAERGRIYLEFARKGLEMFPGARDFLSAVSERNVPVGLGTSSRRESQRFAFGRFSLHSFFDVVVTAEDVKRGKPLPEVYLLVAERLGLEPEKCLVVEDSDNGVKSAVSAGCVAFGLTHTFSAEVLLGAGARRVFPSFSAMRDFLFV